MKTHSLFKSVCFIFLLFVFKIAWAQSPNELVINMNIDFEDWNRSNSNSWYDQISFTDNGDYDDNDTTLTPNPDNGKRGKFFRSRVKPNQKLKWISSFKNAPEDFSGIILISVMRNPKPGQGGNELLDKPWYNSNDDGDSIKGRVKNEDLTLQIERYTISFAIQYGEGDYDIYTVDPIIRGNQ